MDDDVEKDRARAMNLFDAWREAAQRFDYVVLAGAGALCAFVAERWEPTRMGLSPGTLELAALLVLVASVVVGFKRIERSELNLRINHDLLQSIARHRECLLGGDADGARHYADQIATCRTYLSESGDPHRRLYNWRNGLLLVGFLMLIAANVWRPYAV